MHLNNTNDHHLRLPRRQHAFTLVELLVTVALAAVLAAIAYPAYTSHVKRVRVQTAITDMQLISTWVERYVSDHGMAPATLADAGMQKTDPWGQPYQYLRMSDASVGQVRKDRSLHPLNTDFDLYSMGPDGRTASPLTAAASQDDIIRAGNGSYFGPASAF